MDPFSIHPNPGNSLLNIAGLPMASHRLRIVNAQGVAVRDHRIPGPSMVGTDDLAPGMYMITILQENGTVHQARWIKL